MPPRLAPPEAFIIPEKVKLAADAAAAIDGVAKVLFADDAALGHGLPENLAPLVQGLCSDYSHVLAPATTFGKNLMPRVAALRRP